MRNNYFSAVDRNVSAIGFGCASLGSRISATEGLASIQRALNLGVSWFDVAPPYGDGQAEYLLGKALGKSRGEVVICTKVGIERPQISGIKKLLRPVARAAVKVFPGVRGVVSKARSTGDRPMLRPEYIEASVIKSLQELGTDYIDVLALHEPPLGEVCSEEIIGALQRLVQKGMVRSLSVAGDEHAVRAALTVPAFKFIQFPDSPYCHRGSTLKSSFPENRTVQMVTHGVFGQGVLAAFQTLGGDRLELVQQLAGDYGLVDDVGQIDFASLLLAAALSANPDGVVIMSMFSERHANKNAAIAQRSYDGSLASRLGQILADRV